MKMTKELKKPFIPPSANVSRAEASRGRCEDVDASDIVLWLRGDRSDGKKAQEPQSRLVMLLRRENLLVQRDILRIVTDVLNCNAKAYTKLNQLSEAAALMESLVDIHKAVERYSNRHEKEVIVRARGFLALKD